MNIRKILFEYLYVLITIVGIGFAFWYYEKGDTVPIEIFFLFILPLSLLCLMLIQKIFTFNHRDSRKVIFPKLKAIAANKCIFEESNLFSHNSLVSFYLVEDFEQYLGYGFIETITQKNTLQVFLKELRNGISLGYLHENKKRIILKPSIPVDAIQTKE